MLNRFEPLNPDDVLSIKDFDRVRVVVSYPMFKAGDFQHLAQKNLLGTHSDKREERWLGEGVSCETLKPGGYWQKGKVRLKITLEFCPDEPIQPPSPLDDLRKQIKETEKKVLRFRHFRAYAYRTLLLCTGGGIGTSPLVA